jgi:hypothetical protein
MLSHLTKRHLAAILFAALLGTGCASQSSRPDADAGTDSTGKATHSDVERRALERWALLIEHKAEKAYDYLSPGYRQTKSRDEYAKDMNNRPVRWSKVMPYRQACDKPDVCELDLQVDFETQMPGMRQSVASVGFVNETWIRTGGKWYLLPKAKDQAGRK